MASRDTVSFKGLIQDWRLLRQKKPKFLFMLHPGGGLTMIIISSNSEFLHYDTDKQFQLSQFISYFESTCMSTFLLENSYNRLIA